MVRKSGEANRSHFKKRPSQINLEQPNDVQMAKLHDSAKSFESVSDIEGPE